MRWPRWLLRAPVWEWHESAGVCDTEVMTAPRRQGDIWKRACRLLERRRRRAGPDKYRNRQTPFCFCFKKIRRKFVRCVRFDCPFWSCSYMSAFRATGILGSTTHVTMLSSMSRLPSRGSQVKNYSPGYMEQAPSRGHEASPQSGLRMGFNLCSSSKKNCEDWVYVRGGELARN